ncbi:MAG: ROK family protein [Deltaproteobacteria bacterium]|nr:ROK family protein [Deltaproteobacteria bacterium]
MQSDIHIGIDLGGSKIEIVALDPEGAELYRQRMATPAGRYEATLDAIKFLVDQTEQSLGCCGTIGIGTPGAVSKRTGFLKNSNSTCLNGRPLRDDLEYRLGRPIRFANDADCFALSEATGGAGESASTVFGVILGTGVGGGIAVEGGLLKGPNGIAGEWGHNPLPWPRENEIPGPECYCGKRGCIETFISGPGLSATYARLSGHAKDARKIAELAENGDEISEACFRLYENRLARALSHVINILDPEVIVLGGGLSNCRRLYHHVPQIWGQYIFSDSVETRLLPPKYGDSSGVRGAALLWMSSE